MLNDDLASTPSTKELKIVETGPPLIGSPEQFSSRVMTSWKLTHEEDLKDDGETENESGSAKIVSLHLFHFVVFSTKE